MNGINYLFTKWEEQGMVPDGQYMCMKHGVYGACMIAFCLSGFVVEKQDQVFFSGMTENMTLKLF